jgi:hypothetical protein
MLVIVKNAGRIVKKITGLKAIIDLEKSSLLQFRVGSDLQLMGIQTLNEAR